MSAFRLPTTRPAASPLGAKLSGIVARAGDVILGKDREIRLAVTCLMARGHLLIEDIPGVGKTTLAHVLARILGLSFQRVQFTSDLLPADILGISVYDRRAGSFEFHPGPIFTNLVLADEVNRATPKTQSALLEAMEERQVSQDRVTRDLPDPFFVIATQNPDHNVGTFPLPESQLDRFLMRITLGYPDAKSERALLTGCDRRELVEALEPALEVAELLDIQKQVQKVHVSDALLDYLQDLIAATRPQRARPGSGAVTACGPCPAALLAGLGIHGGPPARAARGRSSRAALGGEPPSAPGNRFDRRAAAPGADSVTWTLRPLG